MLKKLKKIEKKSLKTQKSFYKKPKISGKEEVRERKRPDVSARRIRKKGFDEKVVKGSLQKLLSLKVIRDEIQARVFAISQATQKASLIFNRFLIHCLENRIPLPDFSNSKENPDKNLFIHCFTIGETKLTTLNKVLGQVWDTFFQEYPRIRRYAGDADANSYKYAAKTYRTNFMNSLVFPFQSRQKQFVKAILRDSGYSEKLWYPIVCSINGWDCKAISDIPEDLLDLVECERSYLENSEPVTRAWLKQNPHKVLNYYHHILQWMEDWNIGKKFTLAPVCRIKSHFLTIDNLVLHGILTKTKQIKKMTFKQFKAQKDQWWDMTFNYKKFSKKEFSYMIQTDGVSACVHFVQPKKPKVEEGPRTFVQPQRTIAIDPGRTNLMYGVEKLPDGTVKKYQLTRKTYYNEGGMKKALQKAKRWEAGIKAEEDIYKQVSLKTTRGANFDQFLTNYYPIYAKLWQVKTQKKWGRERLRVYSLKRSCLDRFFNTMNGPVKPVIAYGAGKFNPTGKGELSAPTTSLSQRCSLHFPTVMVDEFRTTAICHECDCQLRPVGYREKQLDGSSVYREIRGLRWCSSTKCRTFKNRDKNAALNILRVFLSGGNRPNCLSRNSGWSLVKVHSLMIV